MAKTKEKGKLGKLESEPGSRIVKTKVAVAKHFHVKAPTIKDWGERECPMPGERGRYDLDEIEAWREATFKKTKHQNPVADFVPESERVEGEDPATFQDVQYELQRAKLRKEEALAKQNEVKASRMDDEFVQINVVNEWVAEFLALQRRLLTAIPVEMFAAAPDDIRDIYMPDLRARINIHLNQMADWIERVEDMQR